MGCHFIKSFIKQVQQYAYYQTSSTICLSIYRLEKLINKENIKTSLKTVLLLHFA